MTERCFTTLGRPRPTGKRRCRKDTTKIILILCSVYICVHKWLNMFVGVSWQVPLSLSVYMYVYIYIHTCIWAAIFPHAHVRRRIDMCCSLSIYLSIDPSIHPSISLSLARTRSENHATGPNSQLHPLHPSVLSYLCYGLVSYPILSVCSIYLI